MIDKKSEEWQQVPLWVSLGVLGFRERKQTFLSIIMLVICGLTFFISGGWGEPISLNASAWLGLYLLAVAWFGAAFRWIDRKGLWSST